MCKSVTATATNPENIVIFAASNGGDKYVENQFPIDCPTVYMWNELAKEAMKNPDIKLFMLCADDVVFSTPGWDRALLDHYAALVNKIHVYSLQDSRDKDGTPHPIITREYIDALGYFMVPIFVHWFVDIWTICIAKYNNCFTHLRDFELQHIKPSDTGMADETHNRIRRNGWHARDAEVNKDCQYYLIAEMQKLGDIIEEKESERLKA